MFLRLIVKIPTWARSSRYVNCVEIAMLELNDDCMQTGGQITYC